MRIDDINNHGCTPEKHIFLNIYRCSNVMGFTGVLGQYEAKEQIRQER
jgi:hypothetical protein